MAWVLLASAGILEIVWAYFMKKSAGFTLLVPTAITVAAMVASFGLLAAAMRTLPLGTAYAVWTGIGTIGTVALGILLFNEPSDVLRLASIGLILAGILGLKLVSGH